MELDSDIILFERIKTGDRFALDESFRLYYAGLCRFASSYVSLPESEELVSDVFFSVWQNRLSIQITKSFRAYLFASVKYACYKAASSKGKIVSLSDRDHNDNLRWSESPHDQLAYAEIEAHINQSLNRLPTRCRQIFTMSRFDGLRYKEIADILGVSEKTVENQIVKALQIIRDRLLKYQNA